MTTFYFATVQLRLVSDLENAVKPERKYHWSRQQRAAEPGCLKASVMEHPPVPSKTWELSLYELHRTPQEAITDNTEIAVSPRSLHSELMCPICLDMLKQTMTTKECLHRFCQECIITALRSGNKECPTCRKKLVSKRSLRPDPNFDALIAKIYPSRDEYEALQERVLAKLKQHHNTTALSSSIEEGLRLQALTRAQRVRKAPGENESTSDAPLDKLDNADGASSEAETTIVTPRKRPRATSEESAETSSLAEESIGSNDLLVPEEPMVMSPPPVAEIELVFKPHPDEVQSEADGTQMRYIKTTANASGIAEKPVSVKICIGTYSADKNFY